MPKRKFKYIDVAYDEIFSEGLQINSPEEWVSSEECQMFRVSMFQCFVLLK